MTSVRALSAAKQNWKHRIVSCGTHQSTWPALACLRSCTVSSQRRLTEVQSANNACSAVSCASWRSPAGGTTSTLASAAIPHQLAGCDTPGTGLRQAHGTQDCSGQLVSWYRLYQMVHQVSWYRRPHDASPETLEQVASIGSLSSMQRASGILLSLHARRDKPSEQGAQYTVTRSAG
jgi:hypothetical protein